MTQLFTKDKNDTGINTYYVTFNNRQSPYRIVRYKRPQNDKCQTIQTIKLTG